MTKASEQIYAAASAEQASCRRRVVRVERGADDEEVVDAEVVDEDESK